MAVAPRGRYGIAGHTAGTGTVTGFTMIELVVTMVIIGIMAFVVLPRFDALGGFDVRGAADQAASYLRFAQKSALAQRRHVKIDGLLSTSTSPTITVWDTAGCTGTSASLTLPGKFASPKSSVSVTGTGTVCFDTLGGPAGAGSIVFTGGGATRTVTIEAVTGFVHAS